MEDQTLITGSVEPQETDSVTTDNVEPIVTDLGLGIEPESQAPVDQAEELTELEKLTQKRTGFWEINLTEDDVKWIKNACNGKFDFTGPNEAFMLMNCYLGFSAAHGRMANKSQEVENTPCVVQASAIESCAYFMNRLPGKTLEQAQRSFRIAMALNPVVMEMRTLDQSIEELRAAEKADTAEPK